MASGGYKAPYEHLQSEIGSLSLTGPRHANIMEGAEENTRRIVLLGKTGTGKSSLANTMFGEKGTFTSGSSAKSVTKKCQSETRTINGRSIQLIDTPGFFDTNLNSEELRSELLKCIVKSAPGPHAFLLVFPLGRFTPQEEEVVDLLKKQYFNEDALKNTTVVFTRGDDLPEGMKIEDWLKTHESLKNLVDECGGRCFVVDNKYWNKDQEDPYRNNQYQIEQLLKTINQPVRETRGHYTNEIIEMVENKIIEKKAEIKQSSPNISEKSLMEMAGEAVYNFLKNNLKHVAIGAILGAFLGGVAGVALAQCFSAGEIVTCVAGGVGGALGVPVGAVGAVGAVCTVRAVRAVGAVGAVRAVRAVGAVGAVGALGALEAIGAVVSEPVANTAKASAYLCQMGIKSQKTE